MEREDLQRTEGSAEGSAESGQYTYMGKFQGKSHLNDLGGRSGVHTGC